MTRPGPVEHSIDTGRLRMRYLDWPATADDPGVPVLLLHPNRSCADVWRPFVERSRLGNRFVAVDLRGHGGSDWPDGGYTHADAVADIDSLRRALALERMVLVASAISGLVALLYATQHPAHVAGVIANDVGYAIDPALARRVQERIRTQVEHASAEAALAGDHATDHWDASARALFASAMFVPSPGGVRWRYQPDGVAAMMEPADPPLLEVIDVRCPTLLVRGEHSKPMSAAALDALAAAIPGATTAVVPDADHILSLDNPDDFARLVDTHVRAWSREGARP